MSATDLQPGSKVKFMDGDAEVEASVLKFDRQSNLYECKAENGVKWNVGPDEIIVDKPNRPKKAKVFKAETALEDQVLLSKEVVTEEPASSEPLGQGEAHNGLKVANVDLADIVVPSVAPRGLNEDSEVFNDIVTDVSEYGVRTPIRVTPCQAGGYTLVDGLRRFSAARKLGHKTIPAIIEPDYESELTRLSRATLDNIRREEMSWIDVASVFKRLFDSGWEKKEIARVFGMNLRSVHGIFAASNLPARFMDFANERPDWSVFAEISTGSEAVKEAALAALESGQKVTKASVIEMKKAEDKEKVESSGSQLHEVAEASDIDDAKPTKVTLLAEDLGGDLDIVMTPNAISFKVILDNSDRTFSGFDLVGAIRKKLDLVFTSGVNVTSYDSLNKLFEQARATLPVAE